MATKEEWENQKHYRLALLTKYLQVIIHTIHSGLYNVHVHTNTIGMSYS